MALRVRECFKSIALSGRGSASIGAPMELLFLIPVLAFVAIYAAYSEWLNAPHRRWLGELDLYKRRLSAYEELKRAVGPLLRFGSSFARRRRPLRANDVGHAVSLRQGI